MTTIKYGSEIVLKHLNTGGFLTSPGKPYTHTGTSGQDQVACAVSIDPKCSWIVKPPDGHTDDFLCGKAINNIAVLTLENRVSRKKLHSHKDRLSPVSGQQEVTCFVSTAGKGDQNDNWMVELDSGETLTTNSRFRLKHIATGRALHSHKNYSHSVFTSGLQEVTGYDKHNDDDFWIVDSCKGPDVSGTQVKQTEQANHDETPGVSKGKSRISKTLIFVLVTVLLGAIGSGIWEKLLRRVCDSSMALVINCMSWVVGTYKDSLYDSAADGFHEGSALFIHSILLTIFPMAYMWILMGHPWISKSLDGKSKFGEFIRSSRGFYLIAALTIAIMASSVLAQIRVSYTNRIITYSMRSLNILVPHLADQECKQLAGSYYMIKSRADFIAFQNRLITAAKGAGVQLPKFDPL
jgi:hypothetical protein